MNYEELNSEFLKFSLDKIFFDSFRSPHRNKEEIRHKQSLEFFITPECNLECKYCYLQKHIDDLYPKDCRNKEIIIENIHKVLRWAKKENFFFKELELFSGEIWHTDFGIQVLQAIYEEYKEFVCSDIIMIPTNGTFIKHPKQKEQIEYYMEKFEELGVGLCISFSIDGAVIEEKSRPQKSGTREEIDKFYDDLFKFHKKHKGLTGLHPMVSSIFSKYFIENHIWWFEQAKKYGFSPTSGIMFLEVRDDNWTEESIKDYIEYIKWQFYYKYENFYNKDKYSMCCHVFKLNMDNNNTMSVYKQSDRISCAIQNSLTIRLGDLSIVPCHRLSYKHLVLGKFVIDDNGDIVDIEAKNPEFAFRVWTCNPKTSMTKCDSCIYKHLCTKGCLGSQYETMLDPFAPCDSVCDLYKAKIDTIIELSKKEGLLDYLKETDNFNEKQISYVNSTLNSIQHFMESKHE